MNKDDKIVSAQIVGIKKEEIVCRTENNKLINVDVINNDEIFMEVMVDLLISGLWVPVNRQLKKFLDYDWLDKKILVNNYLID
ncbi:hypothetical protein [Liquorilactobacillus mali]|uniref:Uncharacterized protein n=1 Tax=Liquorilactobacillus mali KCTC 3596 = DSM 20444 TaxID=1046596 RepID=A0A0R2E495_9LACO|nr:hypothetical protein [Liquorilactobacillus mali]KRN10403.1 hypothetical protein FD00_GL000168 [Liquorilactobacillus mali KCTC 3596 = DSM 20444]MDC7952680.1 hypothetical protein [Liquorilactobacillus mali]QFQ74633.1 hypothetical protein LM596_05675 [Liquorilactobacillus mali]